jgi:hypothetical protein
MSLKKQLKMLKYILMFADFVLGDQEEELIQKNLARMVFGSVLLKLLNKQGYLLKIFLNL